MEYLLHLAERISFCKHSGSSAAGFDKKQLSGQKLARFKMDQCFVFVFFLHTESNLFNFLDGIFDVGSNVFRVTVVILNFKKFWIK